MLANINTYPTWIALLYEARPGQKRNVSDTTVQILKGALSGYSNDELLRAAERQVVSSDFWPTPKEMKHIIESNRYEQTTSLREQAREAAALYIPDNPCPVCDSLMEPDGRCFTCYVSPDLMTPEQLAVRIANLKPGVN